MGAKLVKTSTPEGIFIATPSLEVLPTKGKEASFAHEVRLALLDTNPVFQCLGGLLLIELFFSQPDPPTPSNPSQVK